MADNEINVNALPVKTAPEAGSKMMMIGPEEEYQIDYDQLASAILDKLATKQYSELDTTAKTVLGALDELNGKMIPRELKTLSDVLVYAESMQHPKVEFFECSGSQYTGNFPNIHYNYGTGFILKRNAASMSVIAFPESNQYRPIINSIKSGSWEGWKYFDGTSAQ